jgi:hypothetical protein
MLFFYENLELVRNRKSLVGRLTRWSQLDYECPPGTQEIAGSRQVRAPL